MPGVSTPAAHSYQTRLQHQFLRLNEDKTEVLSVGSEDMSRGVQLALDGAGLMARPSVRAWDCARPSVRAWDCARLVVCWGLALADAPAPGAVCLIRSYRRSSPIWPGFSPYEGSHPLYLPLHLPVRIALPLPVLPEAETVSVLSDDGACLSQRLIAHQLRFCLGAAGAKLSDRLFPPLGESGLGKSTLINSLFLTDLYSKDYPGPSQRIKKTVQLEHPHTVPPDGAVGVEVEGHQAFWTCDNRPFILVLTTVPPHTDSLGVSTKTKAGLVVLRGAAVCQRRQRGAQNQKVTDCHGVTQNGSGSSSVTSPALVLVETPNESVCGQHQDERFVVTRPEGLVSLHPYRTICRNCVRMFKLHGMDYHRTPLGTSTAPYRDVWRVGLANTAARRHTERQTSVEQSKVLIKEGGVQLTLTIVDTPGFGDAVDNSNCWQPVINYIDSKCEDFLNAESRVNRRQMPDNRVHCCLYFIAPSGHGCRHTHRAHREEPRLCPKACRKREGPGDVKQALPDLKPLDIEFMKRLHDKVNVIPLIAKADTLTPEECQLFKKQIMKEIQEHKIKIYEFPDTEEDEDSKLIRKIKERMPLAVVGSNVVVEVNGRKVRGRQYPWGVAEVENGEHCDFTVLRNMLIRTHMQDLKDVTNNVHYENYRSKKLAAVTCNGVDASKSKGQLTKSPLAQMEEERREHVMKMKKMETEMEQVFEMKVKEKKQKLKDSEAELERRHEQMKRNLEAQYKELEEKRRQFEEEKANWEAQQRILEQQKLDASKTMEKNKKKGKIF
ncbi:hypothetical protein NFI96_028741 [Prochilodus magdalenae]|nr:hypothetical protein NFI96_028741 [Prochilodus magdalenae]